MPGPVSASDQEAVFSVDNLLKYMGNDQKGVAVVAKIVRDGIAGGMQPVVLAADAIHQQRYADAGRIFHGLRGSVGTLGTQRFVTASMALELAIMENRHADLPALLTVAEQQFQLALEQAQAWLAVHDVEAGRLA